MQQVGHFVGRMVKFILLVSNIFDKIWPIYPANLALLDSPSSPPITTRLVVAKVSQATRTSGSSFKMQLAPCQKFDHTVYQDGPLKQDLRGKYIFSGTLERSK